MRFAPRLLALCLLTAPAWADEPLPPDAPPPGAPAAPPPEAPAPAPPPEAPPPAPDEQVRHLADGLRELSDLADRVGLDTTSRQAGRLAHAADVAADTLELGLLIAGANRPGASSAYVSITAGGGALRSPDPRAAGELAVAAGFAVSGPTCTLLDVGARAVLATRDGPSLVQSGRVCLGAIELQDESLGPDHQADVLAIHAHEAVGLNVRPSIEAASATDGRRFMLAEAGISLEGLRWYWARRRWSIAGPGVSLGGSILTHAAGGDRRWISRVTGAGWFAELRHHRDARSLTDFALRLFPIAADTIQSGQAIGVASIVPLELIGLGTRGVYLDAAGGLDVTAEDEDDTPEDIAARPDLGIGSWRLALRLGVPRFHAALTSRQHLRPTLSDAAVAERRIGAALHTDLRRVFLTTEAYRAHLRLYRGPGDGVDEEHDTWGVTGEAWLRAGRHLLVGATVEVGRSFAFTEPTTAIGVAPRFGHLVLAQLGWRVSRTRPAS